MATFTASTQELSAEELICRCGDTEVPVSVEPGAVKALPGQDRGMSALVYGLGLRRRWFNITVTGASGSGKSSTVEQTLWERAKTEAPSRDVGLHENFANPVKPGVLYLPPGGGQALNREIDALLQVLDKQIPQLLEQPSNKAVLQQLRADADQKIEEISKEVEDFAREKQIVVQTTQQGVNLIPLTEGRPMKEEEYLALSAEERGAVDGARQEVIKMMADANPKILNLEKQKRENLERFIEASVHSLVRYYMSTLYEMAEDAPAVQQFVESLEKEIVDKRFLFLSENMAMQPFGGSQVALMREQFAKSCRINVVVDRQGQHHAPVVVENHPNFNNLIGGVNLYEERGVLKSDFNQVRAGSLLQASGGYLLIQAHELLQQPLAYAALKRSLRYGQVKLRDQFTEMGFRSGANLEPEPVTFDTKVIVVGDEQLIQLILSLDDEFARLFKINADFSRTLERSPDVMKEFVNYLLLTAKEQNLLPVARSGMTRVVEEASRQVSHQGRLTAQLNDLVDLLIEADTLARDDGKAEIDREIVELAVEQKRYRHSKIEEMVKREISEGTILLDVEGTHVGQINGLAVYQVGRIAFGVPARITAQAYAGRAGLINIEREADLSGRIHTKGMLILNGYLGKLFARRHPLALSVSICFEQNYGGIEGDSATAAEYFATISAITGIPLRQSIAVTGSMNQHGEIQPIGGVNEKINGFFQFCKERNFPEGCGVIIPATNKVNLMLGEDVITAVREGKFHIYPIGQVEEGLELLMGLHAGTLQPDNTYPQGSIYATAMANLEEFREATRRQKQDGNGDGDAGAGRPTAV